MQHTNCKSIQTHINTSNILTVFNLNLLSLLRIYLFLNKEHISNNNRYHVTQFSFNLTGSDIISSTGSDIKSYTYTTAGWVRKNTGWWCITEGAEPLLEPRPGEGA